MKREKKGKIEIQIWVSTDGENRIIGNKYSTFFKNNLSNGLYICLIRFYSVSTFIGYLLPNLFYTNKQFYFKQFNLAYVHSLSKIF